MYSFGLAIPPPPPSPSKIREYMSEKEIVMYSSKLHCFSSSPSSTHTHNTHQPLPVPLFSYFASLFFYFYVGDVLDCLVMLTEVRLD